jgi:hypothetical protein
MRVADLDPARYRRHMIHGEGRTWPETNCYTDVLIEMLHGFGHEPAAGLAFTLACDFEGDQWTFFKFPHADLQELYGWDVQELAVWRPLAEHVAELVAAGRLPLLELDAYYLPDTAGSAYRLLHQKSSVCVNRFDPAARSMDYFHNQGFFRLQGEDFAELFQEGGPAHERVLPPYFEFVKMGDPGKAPRGRQLLEISLALLDRHLARVPRSNPLRRFKQRFAQDLEWLQRSDIAVFHAYSFVTLRMYGACYELAETYLRWLQGQGAGRLGESGLGQPIAALQRISQAAKALQFQLARSMARKKALDLAALDSMAADWDDCMERLQCRRN